MFSTLLALIPLAITVSAGLGAYLFCRGFVRQRLRFVDAVRSPFAPIVAGAAGFLLMLPLAALPWISMVTAAVVGIASGMGTSSGVKSIGRWEASRGRLLP